MSFCWLRGGGRYRCTSHVDAKGEGRWYPWVWEEKCETTTGPGESVTSTTEDTIEENRDWKPPPDLREGGWEPDRLQKSRKSWVPRSSGRVWVHSTPEVRTLEPRGTRIGVRNGVPTPRTTPLVIELQTERVVRGTPVLGTESQWRHRGHGWYYRPSIMYELFTSVLFTREEDPTPTIGSSQGRQEDRGVEWGNQEIKLLQGHFLLVHPESARTGPLTIEDCSIYSRSRGSRPGPTCTSCVGVHNETPEIEEKTSVSKIL